MEQCRVAPGSLSGRCRAERGLHGTFARAADPDKGKALFEQCAACHSLDGNRVGRERPPDMATGGTGVPLTLDEMLHSVELFAAKVMPACRAGADTRARAAG